MRWAVQAVGVLIVVIGVCVFLALFGPGLGADQRMILWRVGSLFVALGIGVSLLGRLGLRP